MDKPGKSCRFHHGRWLFFDFPVLPAAIIRALLRYYSVLKRFRYISVLLLSLASTQAWGQYDVQYAHYFDMEPAYNPAAAGKESKLNIVGAYALNLAGFEHNPRTMYISGDMPFYFARAYHGAGLQLQNDELGAFRHQKLAVQYSYKVRLLGGTLGLGAQVGLLNESLDGSKLDLEESSDPAFISSQVNGTAIDLAAGLYFQHRQWYAGLSGQHLNGQLVRLGDRNELKIERSYYFTGGYNIKLRNPFLTIKPSAMVKTDLTAWRADVTGRLVYQYENKMMYGGVSYSPTHSVTFLVGGSFHGIVIGYSYEVYTSGISLGNGSHELFVGYQTDINLTKKGRNKHQSVRFL